MLCFCFANDSLKKEVPFYKINYENKQNSDFKSINF